MSPLGGRRSVASVKDLICRWYAATGASFERSQGLWTTTLALAERGEGLSREAGLERRERAIFRSKSVARTLHVLSPDKIPYTHRLQRQARVMRRKRPKIFASWYAVVGGQLGCRSRSFRVYDADELNEMTWDGQRQDAALRGPEGRTAV